ncbi:MAG: glycosyltransferase family 4 protein, partial [Chloroflexi bacterium]|nr:glycosyltransferase family 4 protein [Chloroflexota bacterium]
TYLMPFQEVGAAAERKLSSPVLICVGRLSPEKGIETLLNAASILLCGNHNFLLRIVGAGAEEMSLRHLAAELELESYVEWVGQVSYGPDLFTEYDNATAFILPSLSEGSPDVIAEAMARGVPIVASRVGGIPDLIEENETGLLVDAGDSQQLAEAILKLISDAEMRKRIALNARAEVASHTLQDQYQQMLAILREKFALATKSESSVVDVEVAE